MEPSASSYWTPEIDERVDRFLEECQSFAVRHLVMVIRAALKYDRRSKEGRRALAQARLRVATATDDELEQLAYLLQEWLAATDSPSLSDRLSDLRRIRSQVREKGLKELSS